ncbi:MAG: ATP-binding protein [Rhabdochlamydiaceae bacterium]|nr:ATP-binding protein [Rhabdochlamydiaceae bacterium]
MYKRLLDRPLKGKQSFFLFGPRGTGKTSWIKSKIPGGLYIDLLETTAFLDLSARPGRLEEMIPPGFEDWVIIDEVQKVPILLNEVHRLIENKNYKFILTGSSARSLKKKGVNLLAGRALSFKMFPLTAIEQGSDFDLNKALRYGQLPYVYSKNSVQEIQDYLEAYTQTYVREEVMQEGLTRNIGAFSRFLETASFSQCGVLNISDVAQDASINRKVVVNYFQIVEDLLIAAKLPIFSKRAKRKLIAHSKFYFFDVGVYRAIRPQGPYDSNEEAEGAAYETLVYQEIQAINHYFNLQYQLYFWRTVDQIEVDFVLYGPKGIIGIEVKRSDSINSKDLKGLRTFREDYPEAKLFLFHGGTRREYIENIQLIPISEALLSLPELLS